ARRAAAGELAAARARWWVGRIVAAALGRRRRVAQVLRDLLAGRLLDPRDDLVGPHVDAAAAARCRTVVDAARDRGDHDRAARRVEIDRAAGVAEAGVGARAAGDELAAG